MADMRLWYFKNSRDLDGNRRRSDEYIPYKSIKIIRHADRFYQAFEHAMCVGSEAWGTDVQAFSNHNGWFEWHWQVLPKVDRP